MEAINNFRLSLAFVLKWEGGYSFNPDDPGGETKWGISKRSYPALDIKNLTPEQAMEIYAKDYWDACGCDNLSIPFCTIVFDSAVNCGVGRATDWLRKAPDSETYMGLRKQYYINLVQKKPALGVFLKGWLNRLQDLSKFVEINS